MTVYCTFAKKNEVLHDFTGRLCFRRGKEILTGADLRREAKDKGQPVPKRPRGRPPKSTATERPVPRPRGRPKKAVSSPKVSKPRGRPKGSGKRFGTKAQVMADHTGTLLFKRGKRELTGAELRQEWIAKNPIPYGPLPGPILPKRGRPKGSGKIYGTKAEVMADMSNTLLFKRKGYVLNGEQLRLEARTKPPKVKGLVRRSAGKTGLPPKHPVVLLPPAPPESPVPVYGHMTDQGFVPEYSQSYASIRGQQAISNNLANLRAQVKYPQSPQYAYQRNIIPKSHRHALPWLEPPPTPI